MKIIPVGSMPMPIPPVISPSLRSGSPIRNQNQMPTPRGLNADLSPGRAPAISRVPVHGGMGQPIRNANAGNQQQGVVNV